MPSEFLFLINLWSMNSVNCARKVRSELTKNARLHRLYRVGKKILKVQFNQLPITVSKENLPVKILKRQSLIERKTLFFNCFHLFIDNQEVYLFCIRCKWLKDLEIFITISKRWFYTQQVVPLLNNRGTEGPRGHLLNHS